MNVKYHVFMFGVYSFLSNLFFIFLEFLPQPIRNVIFSLMFKKFGKNNLIDYKTYFRYPKKISIGSGVSINRGCHLFASHYIKEAEIIIGDNVSLAPGVTIFSASHDFSHLSLPHTAKSVVINNNVWVGGNSILLPGVKIGEGAVVGAGSVVAKDIPPYTVVCGSLPLRTLKMRILADDVQ